MKEVKLTTFFVITFHEVLLCGGKVLLPVLIIKGGAWVAVGVALIIFQPDLLIVESDTTGSGISAILPPPPGASTT